MDYYADYSKKKKNSVDFSASFEQSKKPVVPKQNPLVGGAIGFLSGRMKTLQNIGNAVLYLPKKAIEATTPGGKIKTGFEDEVYKNRTKAEAAGDIVGKIAEFAIPGSAGAKGTAALSALARVATRATVDAGIAAAQSGGDANATAAAGLTTTAADIILGGKAKFLKGAYQALETPIRGALSGYTGDVVSGLAGQRGEDRTGRQAFIPGLGTVIGGALGSASLPKGIKTQRAEEAAIAAEQAAKAKVVKVPVRSESTPGPIPISTPKSRYADYRKAQGYEPYLNPNELPVIEGGAPIKVKSNVPTISSDSPLGVYAGNPDALPEPYTPWDQLPVIRADGKGPISAPKKDYGPDIRYEPVDNFPRKQIVTQSPAKPVDNSQSDVISSIINSGKQSKAVQEALIPKQSADDFVYQGVGEGMKSRYWATNIKEAEGYANQQGLKGKGQINAIRWSDIPDDVKTIFPDENIAPLVREKFGDSYIGRVLTKQEYEKIQPHVYIGSDIPSEKIFNPKQVAPIGQTITPSLSSRVEVDAIEKNLVSRFEGLPEVKTMNMRQQATDASDLVTNNYDQAKRVAMGLENAPGELRDASVFEAVKQRAIKDNDIQTLKQLATESTVPSKLTAYGQEIKAADNLVDSNDPVELMQSVIKSRAKNPRQVKAAEAEVRSLKDYIDKNTPKIKDINQFINDIEC